MTTEERLKRLEETVFGSENRRFKVSTTKEAYEALGIKFTDDQLRNLSMINAMSALRDIDYRDHVTLILFILRLYGLMPDPSADFPLGKLRYENDNFLDRMECKVIRVPSGMIRIGLNLDGKKILVLKTLRKDGEGAEVEKSEYFLVEHLLNENLEVTEQTLLLENEIFRTPENYNTE